jgi:hypothetical protein
MFVCIIYCLLGLGESSQRTYSFSVLKELENVGALNMSADELIKTTTGESLIRMKPMKQFHSLICIVSLFWAFSGIGLCAWTKKPSDTISEITDEWRAKARVPPIKSIQD